MAYAFLWNSLADKMLLRFLGLRVKRREAKEEGEKREESGRRGDLDGRLFFFTVYKAVPALFSVS